MPILEKNIVRARLTGKAESHSRTRLTVRDLSSVSDEPEARGGTNQGLAPTELLIAALVSCTNVISHKIADKHGIEIIDLAVTADYELDRRGVTLQEEVDIPFPEIRLVVSITTLASQEDVKKIQKELPRFCAVSKVVAESGTLIVTDWIVNRPE